ncbi:hypothetical protein CKY51_14175 [Xanthomonas maliensis]|nr:hypothetical protein CKY51_14175 [Xanthomonas maliensis]
MNIRTLDIIEIDSVAGGRRTSIGSHPLSSSIHHANAHKKVHHSKTKPQHRHVLVFSRPSAMEAAIIAPLQNGRQTKKGRLAPTFSFLTRQPKLPCCRHRLT